ARLSEARNSYGMRAIQAAVEAPYIAGAGGVENCKKKKQRDVVEVCSEIFPERRAVPGCIPGGKRERNHQNRSGHRCRADQQSKDEAQPDTELAPCHYSRTQHRMDQNEVHQKCFVESDGRAFIHELMDPALETTVGPGRARDFIFGEE